jgi:hypothetical protein
VVLQALATDAGGRFASAVAMDRALASVSPDEEEHSMADDETASFRRPARPVASYVPPPVPVPPSRRDGQPPPAASRQRPVHAPPRRRRNWAGLIVTLLAVGAIAGIVWLVLSLGRGNVGFPSGTPSPGATTTPAPGFVSVPDTVGMTFEEGIAAAQAAGLDWTVACDTQPDLPEEIYAQEPAAGEQVAPGSRFTMFFPRFEGYCG